MNILTTAIVLNSVEYEENDKIINLFSKDFGKISMLAKGVNKPESKNRYSINEFSLSEFEIFKSRSKERMSRLKTGTLINSYLNITNNYNNYLYASILISLYNVEIFDDRKPFMPFEILNYSLMKIDSNDAPFQILTLALFFIMKYFGGYWVLNKCIRCNKKNKAYRIFDFDEYGLVCVGCFRVGVELIQENKFVQFMLDIGNSNWNKVIENHYDQQYIIILFKILTLYFEKELGITNNAIEQVLAKKIYTNDYFIKYLESIIYPKNH